MTTEINGQMFYGTSEACKLAGISRFTFLRLVREKKIVDVRHRDQNGWRLFTDQDVNRIKTRKTAIKLDV
jgi:DNA-binding transcriptional MerR regulator